jgi:hypothetical protein
MRVLPAINKIGIDEPGVHRLGSGSGNTVQSCPTITINTPNQFPLTMTIDFGSNCTDANDGKVRSGRMRCTLDRSIDSIGCVMITTLDSFYVNGVHFEGTVTITKTGAHSFRKVIQDGKCTKTGASPWVILWNCDRTVEQTSGYTTSTPNDDVVQVSGSNSGTDRNGKTWTSTITSPLIRDMSCTWITKGTMELTPQDKPTRTVDFGDGSCDNKGTITINGTSFEFTMQ